MRLISRGLVGVVAGIAAAGQPPLAASPLFQPAFLCGEAPNAPKPLATPFLAGIHIFKVATYNRDFSFRNKPAQSLLTNFYRSLTAARRGQVTSQ